jgi:uncharacterized protein (UPF0335 family)
MAGTAVRVHAHADQPNAKDDDMFDTSPEALAAAAPEEQHAVGQTQLKSFVERIERLEEDKAGVSADLKELYAEVKGNGFDVKTVRKVIKIRKQDRAKRQEEEAMLELYMSTLGEL